jgi:hypothetical protein
MNKAPEVLVVSQKVQRPRPAPRLKLLVEWESGRRVFFSNLADLLISRRVPPVPITSRPGRFWNDVFVPTGAPWFSFTESILLHLLLIVLFVWGQSRVWVSVKLFPEKDAFHRAITYYPPPPTFRAAESRAPSHRTRPQPKHTLARQPAPKPMPVTPEHRPSIVTPPDIKQAMAKAPNLPSPHAVTPMEPLSASGTPRRSALAGPSGVVAPQPQVDQATARQLALPRAAAVAPAPDLGGSAIARTMKAPNASGVRVVPPPPSVQSGATAGRAAELSSLPGARPTVVPPPPAVQTGIAAGDERLNSMAGAGSQVVPPAPSVQGAANAARAGSLSSLSGARPNVVPPPPSVQAGNAAGDARLGSMTGEGSQVVPPPPAVQGSGSDRGTRLGSLSGADSDAMPPASVERAGKPGARGAGKILEPMDPLPTDGGSSGAAGSDEDKSTVEELPLGLIGVVFAAPGTSFFSNFEVFVAKRRMGKDQLQLIKLVYEFLPYQRRLSQYNLNNQPQRIIKLRVTPDPSCDESLGQIIQGHADPASSETDYPKLPKALRSADLNAVLPCYRTTATDFQKAMLRKP